MTKADQFVFWVTSVRRAALALALALVLVPGLDGDAAASTARAWNLDTHAHDSSAASTTPSANTRAVAFRACDDQRNVSRARMPASGGFLAAKGADDAADLGTDLAVRPKLKPSRHYPHERKMERQLRTADVFDAYKNPLAVGPARYDPFGRPSVLFQGRNAQVAVNPQSGEIVTAIPTGSRLRRQLLRRAGGSP